MSAPADFQQQQLDTMREDLKRPPAEIDRSLLFPILVPKEFDRGDWPGPIERLAAIDVRLTWVVLGARQTMAYVNHETARFWNSSGIDWKAEAYRNLQQSSDAQPYTHHFLTENGRPYCVALMHDDGLGPSRLLVREFYSQLFPDGYSVAAPEMSCGLVFSTALNADEQRRVDELIRRCFEQGTRPLSPNTYPAEQLWI